MHPPLEFVAKAVITELPLRLDKLALSFVPSLDFSTSRRILERTIKLEKNQQVNKSLSQVVQWEKEWNQIKSLSEDCFSLIKSKRVCECQRLFDGKIEPLNKSFNIPTGRTVEVSFERSPDEVRLGAPRLGTRSEMEQTPIPEKDALRLKLSLELDNSRRGCLYQPDLAVLVGVFEAHITYGGTSGRTYQTIADMAKNVLEREGLCDCVRELAENTNKEIAAQGPTGKTTKLDVSLMADKNMLKIGESAYITAVVTGGKPPYKIKWSGALSGQGATLLFNAGKPGSNNIIAEATDSIGNKGSSNITISVETDKTSTKETPEKNIKVNTAAKIGKSKIIVLGSEPETSSSPLKLKVPQGEQSQTLLFTYEHKSVETGKMVYLMEAPSNTTFMIEPSDSGASITRISNPAKWGKEKFFAVVIDKDVKPGKKFTVTAYYSGVPNPQWISNKYLDTGEDAEEYLKKNVKPATAVIEVIGGKVTSGKTDIAYDPTKDPSYNPDKKPIDIAQTDKAGTDFQDAQKWNQPKATQDNQQQAVPQNETYIGGTKKEQEEKKEKDKHPKPPYPPYDPYDDIGQKSGTDWTKWATGKKTTQDNDKAPPSDSNVSNDKTSDVSVLSFTAELENTSQENVHIFVEGQDNFGPQNKLAPGEKRKISVTVKNKAGMIKFIAGRNGQKLAECKWEYDLDTLGERVAVVKFSDPKNLSCAVGYR